MNIFVFHGNNLTEFNDVSVFIQKSFNNNLLFLNFKQIYAKLLDLSHYEPQ